MNQLLLLSGNPKRRRGGKRRSAAQRAATRRMLAARFGSNPKRRRRRAKRSGTVAAPRSRRAARRSRRGGLSFLRGSGGSAVGLLKGGAIGGAGAIGVDILMGYAKNVLPASMQSRVSTDGSMNVMYYGSKAALAVAIGLYGNRILPAGLAPKIAEGALTVMAYEILRTFVPTNMQLGFFNPAPTMLPRRAGMGKILSMGKILNARNSGGAGSQAVAGLNALARSR